MKEYMTTGCKLPKKARDRLVTLSLLLLQPSYGYANAYFAKVSKKGVNWREILSRVPVPQYLADC